ncbi:hypothetical protein DMN91_007112 [Ooceraea biroi]|uniref:Putative RNA-binding protein n=1 Tax=Ooceraea biroi TaxID=2015173 RepID=A0A026W738_OOCBI|nr:RNA-binding protein 7 [Ooceraea biroi]EZA51922.1 Putative RNA-binding protein [Ooceraea biroi]RLU20502.1 hypothetical protein DMN91_007112 [Ooceraea biroi]
MDDDARTIYCGNLSDKVTEAILYELFLQGGPVQKVSIPKDRDGKQRTFGFVTYKHTHSVEYALRLLDGTMLYNRLLNMKQRNCTESQQEKLLNPVCNVNHMLEQGQQMILGNYPPRINGNMFGANVPPNVLPQLIQSDVNSGNDDRNFRRSHSYHRDRERNREKERDRDRARNRNRERSRERNDHNEYYRDERSYYRDNRSNSYSRYNDNRKRWTYH